MQTGFNKQIFTYQKRLNCDIALWVNRGTEKTDIILCWDLPKSEYSLNIYSCHRVETNLAQSRLKLQKIKVISV